MSRLRHTRAGFMRKLQMHNKRVYAFVEGKNGDEYFYSKILNQALDKNDFMVIRADELNGGRSGGKQILLEFFRYLDSAHMLNFNRKSIDRSCLFFLDKDIDDILGSSVENDNIIYTAYYNLENFIYLYSDMSESLAACFSASEAKFVEVSGENWKQDFKNKWHDWSKMCVLSSLLGVSCGATFSTYSSINKDVIGRPVKIQFAEHARRLRARASARGIKYIRVKRSMEDRLRQCISVDEYFNGKWYYIYVKFLYKEHGFKSSTEDCIRSVSMSKIDYTDIYTKYYKRKLEGFSWAS